MMSKCRKCGNKLLTVSTYVSEWDADQEPYESGEHEEHEGIHESVYLNACYCEKCEAFDQISIEAEMIEEEDLEKENALLKANWEELRTATEDSLEVARSYGDLEVEAISCLEATLTYMKVIEAGES